VTIPSCFTPECFPARYALPFLVTVVFRNRPFQVVVGCLPVNFLPFLLDESRPFLRLLYSHRGTGQDSGMCSSILLTREMGLVTRVAFAYEFRQRLYINRQTSVIVYAYTLLAYSNGVVVVSPHIITSFLVVLLHEAAKINPQ
jgi:hypothetical protein